MSDPSATRVKYLYEVRDQRIGSLERPPLLSVSVYHGVVPRSEVTDKLARAEDLSIYKVCRPGEIVINRMSAYQGALGMAHQYGIVSPEYIVLRPKSGVDPRFLTYLFKSSWFVAEMTGRVRGIGSAEQGNVRTPRINPDDLGDIRVEMPSLDGQRAIADYLDAETARIDALIEKKQRLLELIQARWASRVSELLTEAADSSRQILLGQVLDRLIDYRGATPEKTEAGVPLLTATNVANGQIDLDVSRQYISEETYRSWMTRGFPEPGDLLLTTEAPLGEVAIIHNTHIALAQRLMLLRPRRDLVSSEYLLAYLRSPTGQAELLSRASGSTVMGVRTDRLRQTVIQVPAHDVQARIVAEMITFQSWATTIGAHLADQVELLREHRQALISAAVTGEVDLPGLVA